MDSRNQLTEGTMIEFSAQASFSQTIQYQKIQHLYDGHGKDDQKDVLDLKNSRKLEYGLETIQAILEEKVNARVEATFEAEEAAPVANDYWSPENTAGRIVGFALKFYEKYSERHGGENKQNLDGFLNLVKDAIGQGIGEAEEALGELPDEKKSTIEQTRDHIDRLLEEFRAKSLERLEAVEPAEPVEEAVIH